MQCNEGGHNEWSLSPDSYVLMSSSWASQQYVLISVLLVASVLSFLLVNACGLWRLENQIAVQVVAL